MAKYQFKCREIGLECDFQVTGKEAADLIPQIAEHARSAHQMDEISDDMKEKINNSIKRKFL
jgi:predicted small metal-binding protein